GAIGVELAYFLSTMGSQVTLVEMLDQILPLEDNEIAINLKKILEKNGLIIRPSTAVQDLKKSGKTVTATLKGKDSEERWSGDCCLVSIGVLPNTENIGLEEVGIKTEKGFIKVDQFLRTNIANHYAIGDCVGGAMLAHKASHEGLVAAEVV